MGHRSTKTQVVAMHPEKKKKTKKSQYLERAQRESRRLSPKSVLLRKSPIGKQ